MKSVSIFSLFALVFCFASAGAAPVPSTVGSNLTAYNNGSGSINNNNWNSMMNSRSSANAGGGSAPTADFGNCNAVILRCAQPKCASGGCTSMDVTAAIVAGCVNSSANCKQYGDELVQYISAQLVASSTAKANQQMADAQNAAAAAAAQSAQQMQMMQAQMQEMQNQMAAQNAAAQQQLQAALEQQKELTAQALADAQSATQQGATASGAGSLGSTELTEAQRVASESGVSADVLARKQISGEILSSIENAEKQLKELKVTMNKAFEYAGCDARGNNCTGPKRVKVFKRWANDFFDPYSNVLDELYDALILAQSVGVDITNIYMMLNNSCNQWGEYVCSSDVASYTNSATGGVVYAWPRYSKASCRDGQSVAGARGECSKTDPKEGFGGKYECGVVKGGHECSVGMTIPPEDDATCTLVRAIKQSGSDEVKRNYLFPDSGDMGDNVRVGCASSALESSALFRNRKKQARIDIETLQRIIEQDAPQTLGRKGGLEREQLKYCALTESGYANLQKYVAIKGLPKRGICINERQLNRGLDSYFIGDKTSTSIMELARKNCADNMGKGSVFSDVTYGCYCVGADGKAATKDACDAKKSEDAKEEAEKHLCERDYGAKWAAGKCDCSKAEYDEDKTRCLYKFSGGKLGGGDVH